MISIQSILNQARQLPLADRVHLAELLFKDANAESDREESKVGRHGLASLTESTRGEDWSEFYPAGLHGRKAG